MMTCQQLADLLLEFLSGELHPEFFAEIEDHLHGCGHCEAFVHSYRVTITLTRRLPTLPLRSEFVQHLEHLLRQLNDPMA